MIWNFTVAIKLDILRGLLLHLSISCKKSYDDKYVAFTNLFLECCFRNIASFFMDVVESPSLSALCLNSCNDEVDSDLCVSTLLDNVCSVLVVHNLGAIPNSGWLDLLFSIMLSTSVLFPWLMSPLGIPSMPFRVKS